MIEKIASALSSAMEAHRDTFKWLRIYMIAVYQPGGLCVCTTAQSVVLFDLHTTTQHLDTRTRPQLTEFLIFTLHSYLIIDFI